jgi:uncharacterized protein YjbI with pentapeptide repeats
MKILTIEKIQEAVILYKKLIQGDTVSGKSVDDLFHQVYAKNMVISGMDVDGLYSAEHSVFESVIFDGFYFDGMSAYQSRFENCVFVNCSFIKSDFIDVKFINCIIKESTLGRMSLSGIIRGCIYYKNELMRFSISNSTIEDTLFIENFQSPKTNKDREMTRSTFTNNIIKNTVFSNNIEDWRLIDNREENVIW